MYLDYMWLQIAVPLIISALNVISQVICFRCLRHFGLLKSEYLGFLMGFLGFILLEWYISIIKLITIKDFYPLSIVNLIIYLSVSFHYFTFLNLGETARRIRVLRELYEAKEGLSLSEILERYNAKMIVEVRLKRLLNNGQIILKDNRYYIGSPLMLFIAKFIIAVKLILLGKRSEFE